MKFEEELKAMREGKKVRIDCWNTDISLTIQGNEFVFYEGRELCPRKLELTPSELDQHDWLIVDDKFCLSDNMIVDNNVNYFSRGDVKEFIKQLKDWVHKSNDEKANVNANILRKKIDELAGERLK